MSKRVLFLVIYFLSPLLPIIAIYSYNPDRYSDLSIFTPMLLGSVAYTWLTAEFILSARPKFMERYFGLDKFYRLHGMMALISIALVLIHKIIEELVMGRFLTSQIGDLAFFIFLGVSLIAVVFMTDIYLQKIKPLLKLKKYLEKLRITKYESQRLIHNLSIIGLVVMFIHVMLTTSAKSSLLVRMIYSGYFSIGAGFYLYHKIVKRYFLGKKYLITAVVTEVIAEVPKMWTLRMIPQQGGIFPYKPGQFGFMRLFGEGITPEEHPFSISSSPTNKEYLTITIKELGDYTTAIKNVTPGVTAILDAPYGRFSYLNFPAEENTVFLAGGVGITPAISMLRHMLAHECHRKVLLFWGINTAGELAFRNELGQMQQAMLNFVFVPVVFNDPTWAGAKGLIDRAKIEKVLQQHGFQLESSGFYVCGPVNMMKDMVEILKKMGISRNRIHFESFSL